MMQEDDSVATRTTKVGGSWSGYQRHARPIGNFYSMEKNMNVMTTLADPCPECGRSGCIHFVRGTTTQVAGRRIPTSRNEFFVCSDCGVEFVTPACSDPLEELAALARDDMPPHPSTLAARTSARALVLA